MLSSIPGMGRSPGERKGYSSSIFACRIPWTVHEKRSLAGLRYQQKQCNTECNHKRSVWNTIIHLNLKHSVQFSSVDQWCLTLWDPMNLSTPGLPVHHQLLEFTQTHAHQVGDGFQPSHPLLSPSPPVPNPSKHQGLFQWVNSSHEVAKVLEFQLQHQSFQWTPRTYPFQDGLVGSPCSLKHYPDFNSAENTHTSLASGSLLYS